VLFIKFQGMKNQQEPCTDANMSKMLIESRLDDLYPCLWQKCYPIHKRYVLNGGGTEDDAIDTFSEAVYILLFIKLPDPEFKLTGSVCGLVNSIAKNLWLKRRGNLKRVSPFESLPYWDEDEEFWLLALFAEEETAAIRDCLMRIGKNCTLEKIKPSPCRAPDIERFPGLNEEPTCVVLYMKYYEHAKDEKAGPIIGYTRKAVTVRRRNCRDKLKLCLQAHYPNLFAF